MNEKDLKSINEDGFISDALKDLTDIDINQIQKDVQANKPGEGKGAAGAAKVMSSIANKGLGPAGDTAKELDKMISKGRVDNRSIFARARNSVMQFPCYVTQTIPVNAAQIISKTFERVYASFVQAAISQTKIIDESEVNDLLFLKRFHTNIKESAEVLYNGFYQPIDEFDAIMKESVFHREQISDTMMVEFSVVPAGVEEYLVKESARLAHEPLEGFTYLQEAIEKDDRSFIARRKARAQEQKDKITQGEEKSSSTTTRDEVLSNDELMDAVLSWKKWSSRDRESLKTKPDSKSSAPERETHERLQRRYDANKTDFIEEIKHGNIKGFKVDNADRVVRTTSTTTDNTSPVTKRAPDVMKGPDTAVLLKDNEIKKINAMAPYMIQCHFIIKSNDKLDQEAHYLIGVKTILHLIRPQDLSEDLRDLVTGRIKSLQKVKYKTGETSWWEYIFHKKQIKKDAAKAIGGSKRWINTLKRLSEFDKAHGSLMRGPITGLNKGEVPIPNATLILSQPDVSRLTNETGIDLSVVSNAVRLARSLFLICVAIVDSSAGTMRYIFPDSMSDWDVQSLASMEAEIAKTDNSQLMRELNHLVNK